ncbi:hypothetical protein ACR5KS_02955 [Leucobacter sp. W1153]|uniref:hypothetical protein n=1 Tax=Leucobacter sp. W1153 TaxID=3439064 RepID=UPI003F358549
MPSPESEQFSSEISPEHAYCESFMGSMEDYLDIVSGIGNDEGLDSTLWNSVRSALDELDGLNTDDLPMGWSFDHYDYVSARDQIKEALDSGEVYTFEFTTFKTGSVSIIERCVAAGYKKS